jgi:spore germination cell wall hydrolase CwlJ-like protein
VISLLPKKITGYVLLAWFGFYTLGLPLGLILNLTPEQNRSLPKTVKVDSFKTNQPKPEPAGNRFATNNLKLKTDPTLPTVGPTLPAITEKKSTPAVNRQPVKPTWKPTEPVKVTPVAGAQTVSSNSAAAPISDYQFQMLARIISAEAKGEPFYGQVAVGAVILNRVASGRFPKTIAANVLKRGQFEPVTNGSIWNEPATSAYRAARLALNGWDPTGGALYFFNPAKTSSRWIWSRPVVTRIGDHVFAV